MEGQTIIISLENLAKFKELLDLQVSQEIAQEFAKITQVEIRVVTALPETGEAGVFYLVPITDPASEKNYYEEYVWVTSTSKFENLGPRELDLSEYAKTADVEKKIDDAKEEIAGEMDNLSGDIEDLQKELEDVKSDIEGLETGDLADIKQDIEDLKEADEQNVKVTGNQNVAGTKTFTDAPVVPNPTADNQAANKGYVDTKASEAQTAATEAAKSYTDTTVNNMHTTITNEINEAKEDVLQDAKDYTDGVKEELQNEIDEKIAAAWRTATTEEIEAMFQ